jgi:hypothetical protein
MRDSVSMSGSIVWAAVAIPASGGHVLKNL